MKKYLSLLCIALMLSLAPSCATQSRHGDGHPSVNRTGLRAHKDAQSRLASTFGGRNLHGPNKFKRRGKHF